MRGAGARRLRVEGRVEGVLPLQRAASSTLPSSTVWRRRNCSSVPKKDLPCNWFGRNPVRIVSVRRDNADALD